MKRLVLALLLAGLCGTAVAQDATTTKQSHTAPVTPSRAVAGTHNCADFYPELSRRLNQSGDVLVRYDVLADGTIVNVRLVKSSGSASLDTAALTCVKERWRNTPATSGGVPVASPGHEAIIRFTLHDGFSPALLDIGIFRIVGIVLGVFVLGVIALLAVLFLTRNRTPAGAIRRVCPNCKAVNTSTDLLRPPKFCTNCGLPLPSQ